MMKLLAIFVIFIWGAQMEPIKVKCSFGTEEFKSVGEIYICEVNEITEISEKNQEISFDTSEHQPGQDNSKVRQKLRKIFKEMMKFNGIFKNFKK